MSSPMPIMTTYTRVVPAAGMGGVPIAQEIAMRVATANMLGVMSIPDAVAMNVTAMTCIAVVPFMWMVIPVGMTKLDISSGQPSSSEQVFMLRGSVAAEDYVAAPKRATFSGSILAVASSNMIIGASLNIALAIDILCLSPPERLVPPSSMTV